MPRAVPVLPFPTARRRSRVCPDCDGFAHATITTRHGRGPLTRIACPACHGRGEVRA